MTNFKLTRFVRIFTFVAFNVVSVLAWGHSDDYFDANPSPHGGQVRMSGPFHFELVLSDSRIVVYVSDHANQPVQTAGAVGRIEITTEGKTSQFDLISEGDNLLASDWSGVASRELTARLSVRISGQKTYSAKFAPFKRKRK